MVYLYTKEDEKMKYKVRFKVSYCETFFNFDDASEACDFMSMAALHLDEGGDKTEINLTVIREEAQK